MNGKIVVGLKTTPRGVFVACPVCRKGKLTHLYEDTTASGVSLYCRNCKRESIVDIKPGRKLDRVTLRQVI